MCRSSSTASNVSPCLPPRLGVLASWRQWDRTSKGLRSPDKRHMANENLNLWLEDLYGDQAGIRLRLRECLYSATSAFQRIAVYDSVAFGKVLTLGGAIAL